MWLTYRVFLGYTGQAEVVDYFEIAVRLFKGLDSYAVCPLSYDTLLTS